MIVNVKATNKINGEVISYKLEGDGDAGFLYEGTHMQEVADNKIREVNNTLILQEIFWIITKLYIPTNNPT